MSGSPTHLAVHNSNYYSYVMGTNSYNKAGNTKTARLFVNDSGIYLVKNNIFTYQSSGDNYKLKNIALVSNCCIKLLLLFG